MDREEPPGNTFLLTLPVSLPAFNMTNKRWGIINPITQAVAVAMLTSH